MNHSYYSPPQKSVAVPLDGDCLNRKPFIDRLTRMAERLPEGGVIGVDGQWGEGKTWLATHWRSSLGLDWPSVYLNAFEWDHQDDAFVAIASSLLEVVKAPGDSSRVGPQLKKMLVKVGAVFLKKAPSAIASMATAGLSDEFTKALGDATASAAEGAVEAAEAQMLAVLEAASKREMALEGLRNAVRGFVDAREGGKPLVVVVDELDRCRPEFALELLERLKHLFDMPGLVFVLFVNRDQLEAAVATRHGSPAGGTYLDKFVHLWAPPLQDWKLAAPNKLANCHFELMKKFADRLACGTQLGGFFRPFSYITAALALPPRSLERAVSALASMQEIPSFDANSLLPWVLILSVARREIFLGIVADQMKQHQKAYEIATAIFPLVEPNSQAKHCLKLALAAHDALRHSETRSTQSLGDQNAHFDHTIQVLARLRETGQLLRD
jgi:KAP family P-loop domain